MMPYNMAMDKQCFTLTKDHVPLFEVIGYKVHSYESSKQDEVLVNRVVGEHTISMQRQVNMTINPQTVKPGSMVNIEISTTATGTSYIAMRGVDKSAFLLARGHDVSQDKHRISEHNNWWQRWDNVIAISSSPLPMVTPLGEIDSLSIKDRLFNNDEDRDKPDVPGPMPMVRSMVWWPVPYEPEISPGNIIRDAGLSLTTTPNLQFKTSGFIWPDEYMYYYDAVYDDNEAANRVPEMAEADGTQTQATSTDTNEVDAQEDDVRKEFPETWLWDLKEIQTGTTQIQETVPDTITSWVIDVFSLNPNSGLEVVPTQELIVTKPLFISMNLPYSVIRGEQFTLQILVFNYATASVRVRVELERGAGFVVPENARTDGILQIGASSSQVFEVPIGATTIGEIKLAATAIDTTNSTNSDNVERMLLVEPEGLPKSNSTLLKVDSSESPFTKTVSYNLMDLVWNKTAFVQGSLRAYVQVTGDVMGSYVSGFDKEVQMPYGCGEQNIKSMTPGLFVGKYLKAYNKLIFDIEAMVEKVCKSGYSRELNYMLNDGSFSAFGQSDGTGSTWLTAYVLKIFSILGEEDFAGSILNPEILAGAFDFLAQKARPDGEYFVEEGRVIHKQMQQGGGAEGEHQYSFSAFIMVAIQDYYDYLVAKGDSQNKMSAVRDLLTDASNWLYIRRRSDSSPFSRVSPLSRNLIAYTLARSGIILNNTDYITTAEAAMTGFIIAGPAPDRTSPEDKVIIEPWSRPKSLDVEINGYAMLTYVTLHRTTLPNKANFKIEAENILNWLTSKKRADGLFGSTQDTAVAIQAIAEYAIEFPQEGDIDFSVIPNQNNAVPMVVNSNNYYRMQQQQIDMSQLISDTLTVTISGTSGKPVVNLVIYFNENGNVTGSSLNISIENRKPNPGTKPYLRVNLSKKEGANVQGLSTMVVCGIQMPSCCQVSGIEMADGQPIQRKDISVDKKTATLYYMNDNSEVDTGRSFNVQFDEVFEIDDQKPGKVIAYDYYQIENTAEMLYNSIDQTPTVDPEGPTLGGASLTINLILICATSLILILQKYMI